MKKRLLAAAIACTITVQVEAADLSQQIMKHNPSLAKETAHTVARELSKYPPVVTYIVKRESTFNPKARSKGCIGLMGINTKVWTDVLIEEGVIKDPKDLWSIKLNIKAGWHIYKKYKKNYRRYRGLK